MDPLSNRWYYRRYDGRWWRRRRNGIMGGFLELTFIRHGLTTYNEQRRYIGSTNLPLSTRGRASIQQQQLQPNTIIITSDLRRSIETASILYPNEEITPLSSIREMDFGKWEGKTYDELKHNHEIGRASCRERG